MIEVTILIPLTFNETEEFSAKHHAAFEKYLAKLFDGLTRVPGEVQGVWFNGTKMEDDRLVLYMVALKSITEGGKLLRMARKAKRHYRQKAIFIRYLGMAEII